MSQLLKNILPQIGYTAPPNATETPTTKTVTTTTSRSDQCLEKLSFDNSFQQFIRYAQRQIASFTVDATNQPVVEALLAYFLQDEEECQKRGITLRKGVFLMGPVGCGKTTLMQLFARGYGRQSGEQYLNRFRIVSARDIARQFLQEGYPMLDRYGAKSYRTKHHGYAPMLQYDQPLTYCLDDVGMEAKINYYGNECNVIAEVLLDRYDQFVRRGMVTHLTTNLNAKALEDLYGDRVRSRLRQMCNLVCFSEDTKDRRE